MHVSIRSQTCFPSRLHIHWEFTVFWISFGGKKQTNKPTNSVCVCVCVCVCIFRKRGKIMQVIIQTLWYTIKWTVEWDSSENFFIMITKWSIYFPYYTISDCRICMYLCRIMIGSSYIKIGEVFERDHSTVMTAVDKVGKEIKTDSQLSTAIQEIKKNLKK